MTIHLLKLLFNKNIFKSCTRISVITGIFIFIINNNSFGITKTAQTLGPWNWSNSLTWTPAGVPGPGDVIIINAGVTVTVDGNTAIVGNITVNGILITSGSGLGGNLVYSGDMIVNNGASLTNNGGIEQTISGKLFNLNGTATYTHNPKNNTSLDETIFSKSDENFSATSSLVINRWFDLTIPLGNPGISSSDPLRRVQSSPFGNVTIQIPDTIRWEQDGCFMFPAATQRVMGNFTVLAGNVSMDNGNGNGGIGTSDLLLNNVTIGGTGNVIFQSGIDRPLNLTTNDFSDNSTSTRPTVISDSCFSVIIFTVNGNCTISHNFYGIRGSGTDPGGNLIMNVTQNLTIGGGNVSFIRRARAPFSLAVTNNTTIQGTPSSVRFIEGNDGNLNFSTNNLFLSGGANNVLMGATAGIPQCTGQPTITINNDVTINGTSNTTIMYSDSSTKKLSFIVGNNFSQLAANSVFTAAYSQGALTFKTNGTFSMTNGQFIGQADTNCTALDSIIMNTTFNFNSSAATDFFRGNYGDGTTVFRTLGNFTMTNSGTANGQGFSAIYNGEGNLTFYTGGNYLQSLGRVNAIYNDKPWIITGDLTFQTVGTFTMNNGSFSGIFNRASANNGSLTFTSGAFTFAGGNFKGHYSANANNGSGAFTITGDCQVRFTAVADTFMFLGWTTVGAVANQMVLNLTINGNFNIGPAVGPFTNGIFISSVSNGVENITVNGKMKITAGNNSFNSYPNTTLTNAHKVTMLITDSLTHGSSLPGCLPITYLSANNDSLNATVNGNFKMASGELAVQAGNTYGILKIKGGYDQGTPGGVFYLHKNTVTPSYQPVFVDINYDDDANGNFFQTSGSINFDNNTNSTQNIMIVRSPSVTLGAGATAMTMASPGTNAITGMFQFAHAGVVNYSRLTNLHIIQQVELHILSGTTVNVLNGNFQIASYVSSNTNWLVIENGAVLDLRYSQILSNIIQPNSGLKVFGRLRTKRAQGLYDGSANAAINATGGVNFFLLTGSTIEYYADTSNQVVTGVGVGLAISALHKYYDLEINMNVPPDVKYAYPTNVPNGQSVFVRNKLILTKGELNLDNDHISASGGRSIFIERGAPDAITRPINGGYIRSEVVDSSASVRWKMGTNTGIHTFPFGYNSTQYIPFVYDFTAGTTDTLTVSTYHTALPDNLPYPPGVTNVIGLFTGIDNSLLTVDRFWYIDCSGSAPSSANMTFNCTAPELLGVANPRAQRWINNWEYPYQGTQFMIPSGTQVNNAVAFDHNWWTLAALLSPLPVSLVEFKGECSGEDILLKWTTESEENNDYFTLIRSNDGEHYETIGIIDGAGNSTSSLSYSYRDLDVKGSLIYYKLLQTDFDGKQKEYGPIAVKGCGYTISQLDVSVISTQSSQSEFLFSSPGDGDFIFTLYTMDGKILATAKQNVIKGSNIIRLNHQSLSHAIYLLRVEGNLGVISKKALLGAW